MKMESYGNLKVVELRELCKAAGISASGRKAELIASLQANDDVQAQTGLPDTEISVNGSGQLEPDEADEISEVIDVQSEDNVTGGVTSTGNEITALKLKLQLARENRLMQESRERMHMKVLPVQSGATSLSSDNAYERELCGFTTENVRAR